MSGRIRICEGDAALPVPCEVADLEAEARSGEDSIRSALVGRLEAARERGSRTLAVPVPGAGLAGIALQRCAEILLEEARRHLAGATCIEEIRFVLRGEPALRVFESVDDAARIREQAKRWT
jgi:O-acetyl-ADP-ribose deacetylase (regulator of RNase III)